MSEPFLKELWIAKRKDAVERIISTAEVNFCMGEMNSFQKQCFENFLTETLNDLYERETQ